MARETLDSRQNDLDPSPPKHSLSATMHPVGIPPRYSIPPLPVPLAPPWPSWQELATVTPLVGSTSLVRHSHRHEVSYRNRMQNTGAVRGR